jgi:hypothetical protein
MWRLARMVRGIIFRLQIFFNKFALNWEPQHEFAPDSPRRDFAGSSGVILANALGCWSRTVADELR